MPRLCRGKEQGYSFSGGRIPPSTQTAAGKCANGCETWTLLTSNAEQSIAHDMERFSTFSRLSTPAPLMKKELPPGRFLCWICHAKDTEAEDRKMSGKTQNACRLRKQTLIDHVPGCKRKIGACQACRIPIGDIPLRAFHFDHIAPESKAGDICKIVIQRSPAATMAAEIATCQLLCIPCHRNKTAARRRAAAATAVTAGEAFGVDATGPASEAAQAEHPTNKRRRIK